MTAQIPPLSSSFILNLLENSAVVEDVVTYVMTGQHYSRRSRPVRG